MRQIVKNKTGQAKGMPWILWLTARITHTLQHALDIGERPQRRRAAAMPSGSPSSAASLDH
jgi:hypothetical protein